MQQLQVEYRRDGVSIRLELLEKSASVMDLERTASALSQTLLLLKRVRCDGFN
jgi:hypothetical protein